MFENVKDRMRAVRGLQKIVGAALGVSVVMLFMTGDASATTISDSMSSLWEVLPLIIDIMILSLILGILGTLMKKMKV